MSVDDPADRVEHHYEHAPCGFLSLDDVGTITRVNATLLEWLGLPREGLVGERRLVDLLAPGSRIYYETHVSPVLRLSGEVHEVALELLRQDGERVATMASLRHRPGAPGESARTLLSLSHAADRTRFESELRNARHRAEAATARLRVVEQVVAELAGASDVADVLDVVRDAARRAFGADRSLLWIRGRDPLPAHPVDGMLKRGEVVVTSVEGARERFPALTAALEPKPSATVVVAPLTSRARGLGVIGATLDRELDAEEVALLQTLARQAGAAIDRARLFDEEKNVSRTLQRALLPERLPVDARCKVVTLYQPAMLGLDVGGDWYDAFLIDRDRLAVVVGDVVGRGVHAAAAMGQLRSAIRALTVVDPRPRRVLDHLDLFVEDVPAARTATLAIAVVDLSNGRVRYACAGHPPPVLITGSGAELVWDGRSAPLGSHFGADSRVDATLRLAPGDRLVLYTDGLVERRDLPLDQRLDTLAVVLAGAATEGLEPMVNGTVATMLTSPQSRDDVCLLALAYRDRRTFEHSVDCETPDLAGMRRALGSWLETQGATCTEADRVLLACSEAVANAVEHGCGFGPGGSVAVVASTDAGLLRMRVEDSGAWNETPSEPYRGRGLTLMRRVMNRVEISTGKGTVVTMQRRLGVGGDQ